VQIVAFGRMRARAPPERPERYRQRISNEISTFGGDLLAAKLEKRPIRLQAYKSRSEVPMHHVSAGQLLLLTAPARKLRPATDDSVRQCRRTRLRRGESSTATVLTAALTQRSHAIVRLRINPQQENCRGLARTYLQRTREHDPFVLPRRHASRLVKARLRPRSVAERQCQFGPVHPRRHSVVAGAAAERSNARSKTVAGAGSVIPTGPISTNAQRENCFCLAACCGSGEEDLVSVQAELSFSAFK
jgi:hypothetical protein